ncbi:MAG: response regulator [Paracoccaceae bacterium]|nr:response regulator [Paracoccaceae bacterium]
MHVLVVDDDVIMCAVIDELLRSLGLRNLTITHSGPEALDAIGSAAIPFDCFIVDLLMPGMHGDELCRSIRAIGKYAQSPIVVLTALTDLSSIEQAFTAGALDFQTKPINRKRFRQKMLEISHLLSGRLTLGPPIAPEMRRELPPQVIDRMAFENYVKRLGLLGELHRCVFAVKVVALRDDRPLPDPALVEERLAEIGHALCSGLSAQDVLMAYAGDGLFLCAGRPSDQAGMDQAAAEINARLLALSAPGEAVFRAWAGKTIRVGNVRSERTAKRPMELAIRSASDRFEADWT